MPPSRRFTSALYVQVEPQLLELLDHLANVQGTSRSHEVRAAIRDRLARFGSLDALERDSEFLADARQRAAGGEV